jgi:hypothetical protein
MRPGAFLAGDDLAADRRDGGAQIRLIGLMVLLTTPVAFIYHAAMHAMFPVTFSLPTFLFIPNVRFTDFYEPYLDAQLYGPSSSTNTVYSPLVHVFMTALTHIPDFVALTLVMAVFGASLALLTWHGVTARVGSRRLRWAYVLIFCFLSYPVLFLVDRANLEMLVFALLAAFVWLYYWRGSRWAFLPLGLAIAAKYYAVVLLVVLVAERRWRQLALCVAAAVAAEALATVALSAVSGFSVFQVIANTRTTLAHHQQGGIAGVWYSHNLVGAFALVDRLTGYGVQSIYGFQLALHIFEAGLFVLVVVCCVAYDMPAWKRLAALVICMLVLPQESRDYTLIHLFLPLALIGRDGLQCPHRRLIAVLFGLVLVPMAWVPYRNALMPAGWPLNFSMIIYPVVLLALLAVILTTGVTRKVRDTPRDTLRDTVDDRAGDAVDDRAGDASGRTAGAAAEPACEAVGQLPPTAGTTSEPALAETTR